MAYHYHLFYSRLYEGRRSGSLLKIKTFYDAEAIVIGYAEGKGRNKGITGALRCKMESGKVCHESLMGTSRATFFLWTDFGHVMLFNFLANVLWRSCTM